MDSSIELSPPPAATSAGNSQFDFQTIAKLKHHLHNRQKLYADLKNVHSPKGCCAFAHRILSIIGHTVAFLIGLALSSLIPIAMIIVGSVNINKCPIQRYIPIYLIVGGVCSLLHQCLSLLQRLLNRQKKDQDTTDENKNEEKSKFRPFKIVHSLITAFQLAWFIAGNVWVFGTDPQFSDETLKSYCHRPTYYFAFGLIIFTYVFFLFLFLLACCWTCALGCLAIWLADKEGDGQNAPNKEIKLSTIAT